MHQAVDSGYSKIAMYILRRIQGVKSDLGFRKVYTWWRDHEMPRAESGASR
jgi:hypothetical protein